MATKDMQETTEAVSSAAPVDAVVSYKWTVNLYEYQGKCFLSWNTDAPFRAQQGKVCLYAGKFPKDPTSAVAWTWDDADKNPFDTGKLWGTGWCAAYIAQASPNGPYVYFAQTPVTQ